MWLVGFTAAQATTPDRHFHGALREGGSGGSGDKRARAGCIRFIVTRRRKAF